MHRLLRIITRLWPRPLPLCGVALVLTTATSCVEPFRGSHVEFVLGSLTDIPGDNPTGNGRPPSDTHYEMYVINDGYAFLIKQFEVRPVIDKANPCFIEDDQSRFPGLHSTMIADKVLEVITAGGATPTEDQAGQLADAEVRAANQEVLQAQLKAVASYQPVFLLPGSSSPVASKDVLTQLAAMLPATTAMDATSNADRARICKQFFDLNPDYYVGNDKVFSLPVAGTFYGMVDGTDPRNAAFVGGAGFNVAETFRDFTSLVINWQFNDLTDPRIMSFGPSPVGYHYMAGEPEDRTRRVITVPVQNIDFPQISGTVAVYPGIDDDEVSF